LHLSLCLYLYRTIKQNDMTTYRIFTEELNGLTDTITVQGTNKEKAKKEYIDSRIIQSIKGFKRPLPVSVEIEIAH